jgi:hypothetical protein
MERLEANAGTRLFVDSFTVDLHIEKTSGETGMRVEPFWLRHIRRFACPSNRVFGKDRTSTPGYHGFVCGSRGRDARSTGTNHVNAIIVHV